MVLSSEEKEQLRKSRAILRRQEKLERTELRKCTSSAECLNRAVRYQKLYENLFLEYDEVYPEEGSLEDEAYNDKLEMFDSLVKYAKDRYRHLCLCEE